MANDKDYLLYRAEEVRSALEILKQCIERNFPPNDAVDRAITNVDLECSVFVSAVRKFNKEK